MCGAGGPSPINGVYHARESAFCPLDLLFVIIFPVSRAYVANQYRIRKPVGFRRPYFHQFVEG